MALELKSARPASTDEDARRQVRLRVAEIVTDIRTRGEAAVRCIHETSTAGNRPPSG